MHYYFNFYIIAKIKRCPFIVIAYIQQLTIKTYFKTLFVNNFHFK